MALVLPSSFSEVLFLQQQLVHELVRQVVVEVLLCFPLTISFIFLFQPIFFFIPLLLLTLATLSPQLLLTLSFTFLSQLQLLQLYHLLLVFPFSSFEAQALAIILEQALHLQFTHKLKEFAELHPLCQFLKSQPNKLSTRKD